MNLFFRIFKHLLPNARAWRLTPEKTLRNFFEGLSGLGSDIRDYIDFVWLDIFPVATREIAAWEDQLGLPDTGLSDTERRDRLAATWKALGGQSPRYIQDTLQGQGFNVFVHEWWIPGTEPDVGVKVCTTPRDPRLVLRREFTDFTNFIALCGEPLMLCGEPSALCGESSEPLGYPLVNVILSTRKDVFALCGETFMICGETTALCGNYAGFITTPRNYIVPNDPLKWPYFLYIGGAIFGDLAQVPPSRKDEFEAACLKICPAQQWLGILVEYS